MNAEGHGRSAPHDAESTGQDAEEEREAIGAVRIRSVALLVIAGLMVMYTLYFAASLIMPLVLAFLLSLVLSPVVRLLVRAYVPQALSALLVMLIVGFAMGAVVYALAAPAAEWMERAPAELRELESKLAWAKGPIEKIQDTGKQIDAMTNVGDAAGDSGEDGSPRRSFSLVGSILERTPDVLFGVAIMLILLFFLLASGDSFLNNMVQITPKLRDKIRVVETARNIQQNVSRYLATITFINITVGLVITLAMHLLNVPNPLLWGVLVAALNYIPYLGVAISIIIVTFASMLTFDNLGQMLLPALLIFAVNVVEGQFLTPMIAGRRLALSPVAIFLALVVLGWIWGIIGVLIAVPVLASVKLVFEQIEPLTPMATFLGRG